jgi:Tol biopolymer transport system component
MTTTLARRVVGVSLACGLLAPFKFAAQTPSKTPARADIAEAEELIAEKASSCRVIDEEDIASDDGRKIAWRCPTNDKWTVFVNGVPQGGTFDEVRSLNFSPDGQHMAFAARRGSRWMVVEDGTERPGTYADVGTPLYSTDGRRMAISAKPAKKWMLIVDGQLQPAEFDGIVTSTFSPDGQRIAYVGRRGDKFIVVVDGKEGTPSDIVGGILFSSDSRRFAYAAADVKRGFGKQKAVGRATIDGAAGPAFEGAQVGSLLKNAATGSTPQIRTGYRTQFWVDTHGVSTPVFSPDAARVAYAARREKDVAVLLDGDRGLEFSSIIAGPVFSPDNRHIAFAITDKGATALVIDGANVGRGPSGGTDFITELTFAPDNQRVAYIGVTGGSMYEEGLTARARRRVYVDGVAGTEYDVPYLGRLQFSPDGKHVYYVVGGLPEASRKVGFLVVNGREGKRYDDVFGRPRLHEDQRAIRYTAQSGRRFYSVKASIEETAPR